VLFGQESLNQLRGMGWCVVMMQLPCFADTLCVAKSSVKVKSIEPVLISTSFASSRTVTRRFCMTKSTGTSVAVHPHVAIFESIVPLLNLYDAHGIVVENLLNLLNGFNLAIAKLLAKFDAIPLLESFHHFRRK
jgi:hypothetical protein